VKRKFSLIEAENIFKIKWRQKKFIGKNLSKDKMMEKILKMKFKAKKLKVKN
jgi:hypothetical protein